MLDLILSHYFIYILKFFEKLTIKKKCFGLYYTCSIYTKVLEYIHLFLDF